MRTNSIGVPCLRESSTSGARCAEFAFLGSRRVTFCV